jgi:phospholipid/cholesterol/gamma-HCH transport system ATP-binding protein
MKIEKIKFENVCFKFDGSDPVLKSADFEFPENEICWIQSEEGQGKSTLLQILAGLQMPQIGQYMLNGGNVREMTFEEFLPYRLKIGYSFDYGGLISNRTLKENLLLPLQYHKILSPKEGHKRVDEILERFDFVKSAKERPAHVPGRLRKLTCC